MRLFALEYYRQIMNSNDINFVSAKKKTQVKIKNQLGPYVIHDTDAWKDVENILEDYLRLKKSFGWVPYDPCSFISDRRVRYRLSVYVHHRIPEIE